MKFSYSEIWHTVLQFSFFQNYTGLTRIVKAFTAQVSLRANMP